MNAETGVVALPYWHEVLVGLNRQRAVILALIFKEYKQRLGRGKLGLLWLLLGPVVHMLMISMIWLLVGRGSIDGVHVMLYIGTGIICYLIVSRGLSSVPMAITASQSLLNYPQVKPIDMILARFAFEMLELMLAASLLFVSLWWFVDVKPVFLFPLELAGLIVMTMALSLGLSLMLCVFFTRYTGFAKTVGFLSRPLYFMSGVIFSVRDIPTEARWYLYFNPILHLVDSWRNAALGIKLPQETSLMYPLMWTLVTLGLGSVIYFANRYKLIEQ